MVRKDEQRHGVTVTLCQHYTKQMNDDILDNHNKSLDNQSNSMNKLWDFPILKALALPQGNPAARTPSDPGVRFHPICDP